MILTPFPLSSLSSLSSRSLGKGELLEFFAIMQNHVLNSEWGSFLASITNRIRLSLRVRNSVRSNWDLVPF